MEQTYMESVQELEQYVREKDEAHLLAYAREIAERHGVTLVETLLAAILREVAEIRALLVEKHFRSNF